MRKDQRFRPARKRPAVRKKQPTKTFPKTRPAVKKKHATQNNARTDAIPTCETVTRRPTRERLAVKEKKTKKQHKEETCRRKRLAVKQERNVKQHKNAKHQNNVNATRIPACEEETRFRSARKRLALRKGKKHTKKRVLGRRSP